MAQIPTISVSAARLMRWPEFERGFEDARAGREFDWRIGESHPNGQWAYERGRLLAHIAPINMPLRVGTKLNPKAVALFDAALDRKLIG